MPSPHGQDVVRRRGVAWLRSHAWTVWAVVTVAVTAASAAGRLEAASVGAVTAGTAVVAFGGIALHRPPRAGAWLTSTAGVAMYGLAAPVSGLVLTVLPEAVRPTVSVVGTAAAFVLLTVGHAGLLRTGTSLRWERIVEATAIGVALAQLLATVVVRWPGSERLVRGDLLATSILCVLAAVSLRGTPLRGSAPSFVIFRLGICAALLGTAFGSVPLDAAQPVALALGVGAVASFGVAALHPSLRRTTPTSSPEPLGVPSAGFVIAALLAIPLRLVVAAADPVPADDRLLVGDVVLAVLVAAYLAIATDHRRRAMATLAAQEARYAALVRNAFDAVTIVRPDGVIAYASPSCEAVLGFPAEHYIGTSALDHCAGAEQAARAGAALAEVTTTPGASVTVEVLAPHADGTPRWTEVRASNHVDDPSIGGIVVNFSDITDRRLAAERMEYLAYHDDLTGLPNRAFLERRLEEAIVRSRSSGRAAAVLFCDLDRFKVINDSLTHAVGDALLVAIAQRLRRCVDARDVVARLGGDEFVVVCADLADATDAEMVAARIAEHLSLPSHLDGTEVYTTVSIGIAVVDPEVDTPESVLRDADAALYQAKERGRDRYAVFDRDLRDAAVERLELATALRRAIERDEFELHHQPIVSLRTGRMVGSEALLRWLHPVRGSIPPATFIPIAEDTGYAHELGCWVIDRACRQLTGGGRRRAHGGRANGHVVAINASPAQLRRVDFAPWLLTTLRRHGVAPHEVSLEITETVLLEDTEYTRANLRLLQLRGVRIAVDDFGTGYSALSYLKRFRVDVVKIDRAFVDGLGEDTEDEAIVRAIVGMSHALGLECVAEGVERPEQARWLAALGCDYAQGYLFARPMPWADLAEFGAMLDVASA